MLRSLLPLGIILASTAYTCLAGTLIYWDYSPGTIALYNVVQSSSAAQFGPVTTVNDPNAFAAHLSSDWQRVYVVSKWTASEPSYTGVLRQYVNVHHYRAAEMFLWHDNDEAVASNTAVLATTAIVVWQAGYSAVGYALPRDSAGSAQRVVGLVWPDFANVQCRSPRLQGTVSETLPPPERAAALWALITQLSCLQVCKNKFNDDVAKAMSDHATNIANCQTAHGPNSPNWNVDNLITCMTNANTHYSNTLAAAKFTYLTCVDACTP